MANPSDRTRILLMGVSPKEADVYADLIREVIDCDIDVLQKLSQGVLTSHYSLVVIHVADEFQRSLSLLEKIKRSDASASVIMISDRSSVEQAVSAIKLGAEDFFERPFNLDKFKISVRRSLDRSRVLSENSFVSQVMSLLNSCQLISASFDEQRVFRVLDGFIQRELSTRYGSIYKRKKDGSWIQVFSSMKDQAMGEVLDIAFQSKTKTINPHESYHLYEKTSLTPSLFVFPFRCAKKAKYFYVCLSPQPPDEGFDSRLEMIRTQIEVTGNNIKQYRGVKNLIYIDETTGLYNTRYLNFVLDKEIAKSSSEGSSFAVLFIDVDRFKTVNDSHGHLAGSHILNEMGITLRKLLRGTDLVFRYGGDEFVTVLPGSDTKHAKAVAERIRRAVEDSTFHWEDDTHLKITVSIGVAIYPEHANSKKAVIAIADEAMYEAKKKSRNCVYIASPKKVS